MGWKQDFPRMTGKYFRTPSQETLCCLGRLPPYLSFLAFKNAPSSDLRYHMSLGAGVSKVGHDLATERQQQMSLRPNKKQNTTHNDIDGILCLMTLT